MQKPEARQPGLSVLEWVPAVDRTARDRAQTPRWGRQGPAPVHTHRCFVIMVDLLLSWVGFLKLLEITMIARCKKFVILI